MSRAECTSSIHVLSIVRVEMAIERGRISPKVEPSSCIERSPVSPWLAVCWCTCCSTVTRMYDCSRHCGSDSIITWDEAMEGGGR